MNKKYAPHAVSPGASTTQQRTAMTRSRSTSRKRQAKNDRAVREDVSDAGLTVARTVFHSSIAAAQGWLDCVRQLQDVNEQTLKDWNDTIAAAADRVEQAKGLSELFEVQREMATAQLMRSAHNYGSLVSRLFSIEAELVQRAQTETALELNNLREASYAR